jgi:ketosteroid isomerase-like protein
MMRAYALSLLTLSASCHAAQAGAPAGRPRGGDEGLLAELTRITKELEDSVGRGDRSVFERYGTPDMMFINRDGKVYTKAELLADIHPPPEGYQLSFDIAEPRVLRNGDTAVYTFRTIEHLRIFGQKMDTEYRTTNVFVRRGGGWRLSLFTYFERPIDPQAAKVEPGALDALVGDYELAPGKVTRIFRDGGRLMSRRGDAAPVELQPIDATRFFRPGVEGEFFFERDARGRITAMVFRRNWIDLRYRRVS